VQSLGQHRDLSWGLLAGAAGAPLTWGEVDDVAVTSSTVYRQEYYVDQAPVNGEPGRCHGDIHRLDGSATSRLSSGEKGAPGRDPGGGDPS
jgi:hypothetical protein